MCLLMAHELMIDVHRAKLLRVSNRESYCLGVGKQEQTEFCFGFQLHSVIIFPNLGQFFALQRLYLLAMLYILAYLVNVLWPCVPSTKWKFLGVWDRFRALVSTQCGGERKECRAVTNGFLAFFTLVAFSKAKFLNIPNASTL